MNMQVIEENERCFLDRIQGHESLLESSNLTTQGTAQRRIHLQTRLRTPSISQNNIGRDSNCSEEEASHTKVISFFDGYLH